MEVILQASVEALSDFPFEEKTARYALGLTEDEQRLLRKTHLTEGLHFTRHKKGIWLSADGVDKLFVAAGQPIPKKNAAQKEGQNPDDRGPQTLQTEPVMLRVVRADLKNRRMLTACALDDDPDRPKKPLRVRVNSQKNFVKRMEIPAVLVEGYTDLYDLTRPTPRQKGKW